MFLKRNLLVFELLALITSVGCSSTPPRVSAAQQRAADQRIAEKKAADERYMTSTAARETEASNYVEIGFSQGSAALTDSAKMSLNSVVEQAKREGKIEEFIVLSWSDEEYPSKNIKELPKSQRELAERRNKNIEHYVKTMKNVDVNTFNMAERPSAFAKLFNTEDTKLKESMVSAGLSTTDSGDYVNKASRSVILIKVK